MDKRPVVVGNWKMELSHKSALEVFSALEKMMKEKEFEVDVAVCPSFPALHAIADLAKHTALTVGAQNIHEEDRGAYTGSVSVSQIKDFVSWCIVGHSEVRLREHDSDEMVAMKTRLLLTHGITPIVCIGETQEQRFDEQTTQVLLQQIDTLIGALDRVSLLKTVIAYEPIWAIGTGEMPDSNEVYEVMLLIRKRISQKFDGDLADRVRLLYGGSVKSDNVGQYVAGAGADGVLVGGASIHPRDFFEIISNVSQHYAR